MGSCLCFLVSIVYHDWARVLILLVDLFLQIDFSLMLYTEVPGVAIDLLLDFVVSNHQPVIKILGLL